MKTIKCIKTLKMKDGLIAFKKGREYEYYRAVGLGKYIFVSELSEDHHVSLNNFEVYFK